MNKMTPNHTPLVERNDDKHEIYALCEKHKITDNFKVKDCGGIEELFKTI